MAKIKFMIVGSGQVGGDYKEEVDPPVLTVDVDDDVEDED